MSNNETRTEPAMFGWPEIVIVDGYGLTLPCVEHTDVVALYWLAVSFMFRTAFVGKPIGPPVNARLTVSSGSRSRSPQSGMLNVLAVSFGANVTTWLTLTKSTPEPQAVPPTAVPPEVLKFETAV